MSHPEWGYRDPFFPSLHCRERSLLGDPDVPWRSTLQLPTPVTFVEATGPNKARSSLNPASS